jgi:hypothetical protein
MIILVQSEYKVESFINLNNVAAFSLDKTELDSPLLTVLFNNGRGDYCFRLTINEYMHFVERIRVYNESPNL